MTKQELRLPVHSCPKAPMHPPIHLFPSLGGNCPWCGENFTEKKMEHEPYEVSKARIEHGDSSWEGFENSKRQRGGEPTFYKLLEEMAELHDRKAHDYTHDNDPMGNYHFAGLVANLFSHSPHDAGFAGRLAEKIYRVSVLEGGRKIPKNEAIDDTERDIAVIATLWMADRRKRREAISQSPNQTPQVQGEE
jgi:hypothetical protein